MKCFSTKQGSVKTFSGIFLTCLFGFVASSQTPTNDSFSDALLIGGVGGDFTGGNEGATKEPGEPNHAGNAGGKSVWWKWLAPAGGTVTVDTIGSSFDTLLAVYTGTSVFNMSLIANNDDLGTNVASQLAFLATSGVLYWVTVDGFSSDDGNIALRFWLEPAPPRIETHPRSGDGVLGGSVTLTVNASGGSPLHYQWFKDELPVAEGTNASSYNITNATPADAGVYRVTVTNIAGSVTTSNAILTVEPVVISVHPSNRTAVAGQSVSFNVVASGTTVLAYQWQRDGVALEGATASSFTRTNLQRSDAAVYRVVVSNSLGQLASSNAVLTVVAPYTWTTLAGLSEKFGTNDGVGAQARFNWPHGMAVDTAGNIYVTEIANEAIRKITPQGSVSTLVRLRNVQSSPNPFSGPWGVAVDRSNNVYIADTGDQTILKITPGNGISILAGSPGLAGGSDGTNSQARFYYPSGLAVDSAGDVYVADWNNHKIRKISPAGVVSSLGTFGNRDGRWTKAGFNYPSGLGFDEAGNLFVADEENNALRKLSPQGMVSTLATGLRAAHGGAPDSRGNVFVAAMQTANIWRVSQSGAVINIGGNGSGSVDGDGTGARFNSPRGLTVDSSGTVYVSDFMANVIRKGVPFAILASPRAQSAALGSNINLHVDAAGEGPFFYQWFFQGAALPGETNTNLLLGPLARTNEGLYSVVVSNASGNWLLLQAPVRVLVPTLIKDAQFASNGTFRLRIQDFDGGLPADLTRLVLQRRTNLPSGIDTQWQSITSGFSFSGSFVVIDDTVSPSEASRFYRILVR